MSEWKPIETAPRDGTEILLCWIDEGGPNDTVQMLWDDEAQNAMFSHIIGMWRTFSGSCTWTEHNGGGPTHWMPLPTFH